MSVVPVPVPVPTIDVPPPLPLPEDGSLPIGRHLFEDLSGTAGVGKTWMARDLVLQAPGVVLAATTGIAAVNLGEGTTINSLLGYFDTERLEHMYANKSLHGQLNALRFAGVQRIVLDEKSMLAGEQLTYLAQAIVEVNNPDTLESAAVRAQREELTDESADIPPIGLTLVGDFGQLAPVKAAWAFESTMWRTHFATHRTVLTEVKRQDSQEFIQGLHAVRRGDVREALKVFTPGLFHPTLDDSYAGSTVFAKNAAVGEYNQRRLDQLMTPRISCASTRWGKARSEWRLIPEQLALKEGAFVMVLANARTASGALDYVNGDTGRFLGMDTEGNALVDLTRGHAVRVRPVTRECLEPLSKKRRATLIEEQAERLIDGKYEIVGEITYMPLRLAWATTVHKSQGLTLDECQINIGDSFFKHPGMLFVALSRARTLEGLRLVGTPQQLAARCTVNPVVRPWL